jgi:microcystin-dependent protein
MYTAPTIGTIALFAGTFAPVGWAFCNGSRLSIANNDTLFAVIGLTYGGDGQTWFALPDLQSRVAIGAGVISDELAFKVGQKGGAESVTLSASNLPYHTHLVSSIQGKPYADSQPGTQNDPTGHVPAVTTGINNYNTAGTVTMATTEIVVSSPVSAGGNLPVSMIKPVLALNYLICTEGIFPNRN